MPQRRRNASGLTRRSMLKRSIFAATAASLSSVGGRVLGANERLNIAGIGAGGKGAVDTGFCAGENMVALCDVDERNAAGTFKRFPSAQRFTDFRVMLDKLDKSIDAVTVSTPDHLHAVAAIKAMRMGKHVYCQKPLTHSIEEARVMARVAHETGVVTQMGNQGHSQVDSRRLVEIIRSGALGNITEVHVWTDRPIWPQGKRAIQELDRNKGAKAPYTLNWDLWLGPRKEREYNAAYLPFKWRGFWDFGTGALGDMGCHNMDLSFFALRLSDPLSVEAESSERFDVAAPEWSIIRYNFPGIAPRLGRGSVTLIWYDGGKKPDPALVKQTQLPSNGTIMVGDKDTLYVPNYWGAGQFVQSGRTMADFSHVPETLPKRPGDNDQMHHLEWIDACKGNGKTFSNFAYAGPMTESVLLGNVALQAGQKIEWDAKAMKVTNVANSDALIKREYRKGWEL